MNTSSYNQLLSDIQSYAKSQYELLKVRSVEQSSQLIGTILGYIVALSLVLIGIIFLCIAFAAWLEQWLPMWASYLIIAAAIMLIALIFWCGKQLWFTPPIEKQFSKTILKTNTPLQQNKQLLSNQVNIRKEMVERDINNIRQDWLQLQQILVLIRELFSQNKSN